MTSEAADPIGSYGQLAVPGGNVPPPLLPRIQDFLVLLTATRNVYAHEMSAPLLNDS